MNINKFQFNLFIILVIAIVSSCNFFYKNNGFFGHSQTKDEALKNGSTVFEYIPNKKRFILLDGTTLIIDNAWTEISFIFKNNKRIYNSENGYHFSIPIKKEIPESFTFTLSLADKLNQSFTNGADEKLIQLCPTNLYDKMDVILEQKDPDTNKGWTNPIVTDTITFTRLRK